MLPKLPPPEDGNIHLAIEAFRKALLARERKVAGEIVRVYAGVWKRIKQELIRLEQEYRALKEIGQEPGPGWINRYNRAKAFGDFVLIELKHFAQYAEECVREEQRDVIQIAEEQAEYLSRVSLGHPPSGIVIDWHRIDTAVVEVMLGMTQSDSPLHRLFVSVAVEGAKRAEQALVEGVLEGKNPRQITGAIRKALGISLHRALTIARTETLRAHREATRESYRRNSHIISGWIWHSACDKRTCAACWAMHGTIHRLDERLDDHPNGRCTMIPLTKTWEEIGSEIGIDLSDVPDSRPTIETGEMMFERLTPNEQREILGPTRYQAWLDGKLDLADIVGRKRSKQWGTHIYIKPIK